jgi:hypothetical protein
MAQTDTGYPRIDDAVEFLKKKNVRLKHLVSHNGFLVYYGCDSIPFLKRIRGDTIEIWTAETEFSTMLSALEPIISDKDFEKTVYIGSILSDSLVTVVTMWQTTFIHRHDSLFEIEPGEAPNHCKLIFHPKMFQNGRKAITLGKKFNYLGDQIVLENKWVRKGKRCYTIRINNKEDNEETSYSYTFDQDMRFLFWETCQ